MNRELAKAIKQVAEQQQKIAKYSIALEELEKDHTNYDAIPSGYSFFIFLIAGSLGYFAYKFVENSAWWVITLAVLAAVGFGAYLSSAIIKVDIKYRLGRLVRSQEKSLQMVTAIGSEEVAKLGMATIDQIAQKTVLGELDHDTLEELLDIMADQKLVEKIQLNENQILYKGLMPQAQMNIISEVIEID